MVVKIYQCTITDIDGHFSIEVTPNAILQVSYIGYVAQDVPVGNKDNLVISIHEDTQKLDEVVVVGYGSQKKSEFDRCGRASD